LFYKNRENGLCLLVLWIITAVCLIMGRTGVLFAEDDFFDTKIQKVLSGNRIMLQGGTIVQYYGVQVPALNDANTAVAAFAKKALTENERLVKDKIIRVEFVESAATTSVRFAYVFASGIFVNGHLLKNGYGIVPEDYGQKEKYYSYFMTVQVLARRMKKGLWGLST